MKVELTVKGDLQRLSLGPKDVLVLTVERRITGAQASEINAVVRRILDRAGLDNECLIVTDDVHLFITASQAI